MKGIQPVKISKLPVSKVFSVRNMTRRRSREQPANQVRLEHEHWTSCVVVSWHRISSL